MIASLEEFKRSARSGSHRSPSIELQSLQSSVDTLNKEQKEISSRLDILDEHAKPSIAKIDAVEEQLKAIDVAKLGSLERQVKSIEQTLRVQEAAKKKSDIDRKTADAAAFQRVYDERAKLEEKISTRLTSELHAISVRSGNLESSIKQVKTSLTAVESSKIKDIAAIKASLSVTEDLVAKLSSSPTITPEQVETQIKLAVAGLSQSLASFHQHVKRIDCDLQVKADQVWAAHNAIRSLQLQQADSITSRPQVQPPPAPVPPPVTAEVDPAAVEACVSRILPQLLPSSVATCVASQLQSEPVRKKILEMVGVPNKTTVAAMDARLRQLSIESKDLEQQLVYLSGWAPDIGASMSRLFGFLKATLLELDRLKSIQ